jgi:hypothetical protein
VNEAGLVFSGAALAFTVAHYIGIKRAKTSEAAATVVVFAFVCFSVTWRFIF